jgi:hypothetical protein
MKCSIVALIEPYEGPAYLVQPYAGRISEIRWLNYLLKTGEAKFFQLNSDEVRGWGEANAVVEVQYAMDCYHALAIVKENEKPF